MAVTTTYGFTALASTAVVNATTAGAQYDAQVINLAGGSAVFYVDDNAGAPRVLARRLDANGAPAGNEALIATGLPTGSVDDGYDAAVMADGSVVVAWRTAGAAATVFVQRFDANLNPLGAAVNLATSSVYGPGGGRVAPSVAALAGGGFVVAYEGLYSATDHDVLLARFDATGARVGELAADTTGAYDERPSVAGLVDGGFALAWDRKDTSGGATNNNTVAWRAIYNANGGVRTGAAVFDSNGTKNAFTEVAALPSGGFAIAYQDNGYSGAPEEVTTSRHPADGSTFAFTRSVTDGDQSLRPHLAASPNGYLATVFYGGMTGRQQVGLAAPNGLALLSGAFLTMSGGFNYYLDAVWTGASTLLVTSTFTPDIFGTIDITSTLYGLRATTTGDGLGNVIDGSGDGVAKTIYGLGGNDTLTGGASDDLLDGGDNDDVLIGGAGADGLVGGAGSDQLVGGTGADTMVGGAGDDYYYVDTGADLIVEGVNEGLDRVFASFSYALPANVEALFLQGAAVSGTGNAGDNTIIGTAAFNALFGMGGSDYLVDGGGADLLAGGAGDDYYFVSATGGTIIENPGEGFDRIFATVSLVMADDVEALILQGGAVVGIGNAGDNGIIGNALDNVLSGGAGADLLYGFGGADTFVFRAGYGADTVGDFQGAGAPGGDALQIDPALAATFAAFQAAGSQVGADAVYTFGAGTSLTLLNVNFAGLIAADVVFA